MYRIFTASSDTYITNKIVNSKFRATDANVGQAGSLDLFKLYSENALTSESKKATARIVSFAAGASGYLEKTIILVDSAGKTVTMTAGDANARVTEGSGTFIANTGAATAISDNIVTAFNAIRTGDTTKIDMSASTTGGSGIVDFEQSTAGPDGNTVITGTAITSGNIRNENSAIVGSVSFAGGVTTTLKNYESSRILLKFDHTDIQSMQTAGDIDITDPSFSVSLNLFDVYGGQTTPSNFKCIVFPLAKDFDEGSGYDIVNFSDLDSSNYITASYNDGVFTTWALPGAMKSGSLANAATVDVIVSGTLSTSVGPESLSFEQYFLTGEEDLNIDITKFVSASVKNIIQNKGLLLAFSGSYENDTNSYFVKRFSSRDSVNTGKRPRIVLKYDDSIIDNHENFIFNNTGSLYLSNQVKGVLKNLRTGDAPSSIAAGANCMVLKIVTGSFKKTFNVSQAMRGQNRITGLYSSSFAISSYGNLYSHVQTTGSITFDEIWSNSAETITFLSSSLTIDKTDLEQMDLNQTSYHVKVINLADRYKRDEIARIRVFVEDKNRKVAYVKTPFDKKSQVFESMRFRVRDFISGDILVPFDKSKNSTRLSSDSKGMYFDFYMDSLPRGRAFVFDFLITINGYDTVVTDAAAKFVIE